MNSKQEMVGAEGDVVAAGEVGKKGQQQRRLWILLSIALVLGVVWGVMPGASMGLRGAYSVRSALLGVYDLSDLTIARDKIFFGGPGKDGIPAILAPSFASVMDTGYLRPDDEVIGVRIGEEVKAYPLRVLVWHEVVNDTVGGVPIAVTYCPLCGTAMVFERRVGDQLYTFGVSGLLYNSDVLLYDHQGNGLWSQLEQAAVSGPAAGESLKWLSSQRARWDQWRVANPDAMVLTTETGYRRNYKSMPYRGGYDTNPRLMFPVTLSREELSPKTWVVGLLVNGEAKAYAKSLLSADRSTPIDDTLGGLSLRIARDSTSGAIRATTNDGEEVPVVEVYWFAWQAFYPATELYSGT